MTEALILILLSCFALAGIVWTIRDLHMDRQRRKPR
ncbi:hypothetical protein FHX42_001963 [Saccharopolyspora lacisalsi]|uniref:Uncharacterized protein n=1 Tax=Halosaccharopolyspora lacisalsi TaxID=1000566 RepID=A0A839DWK8_9PSEU|nr:hypothetical protein [Halosaccharopolyspora lacisalsi]